MNFEVLKLLIILHELLENSKINVNSRIKPSENKKKLKTKKNPLKSKKNSFFGIFVLLAKVKRWPKMN